jgi:hypothetical protein
MPVRLCSITCAMVFSTVSAEAPGYVAEMATCGGAMFGYWATGSERIASKPAPITRMDSTHANTGRSMKNLTMENQI